MSARVFPVSRTCEAHKKKKHKTRKNKNIQQKILQSTSSGGVCINDTIMQVGINELPFGGVGDSGIGSYHGVASFDTFCHHKSVLKKSFFLELDWRYAPYKEKVEKFKKMFTS